tara:strand:+ start:409 stop:1050 length:642 start_codon:yes stop_codon:yes gene_type:complete
MVYDPSIPAHADQMSVSQGDLLENFTQLNTQFGVNHVPFDDVTADVGKHKFCTFVKQANDPQSQGDEYIIYSKDDTSGVTELFANPEAGQGDPYQITKGGNLFTGITPHAAANFIFDGTVQGSSLNINSITQPNPGEAAYTIQFTTPAPDSNYFWQISGFDGSNNPTLGQVEANLNYATVVTAASIKIVFLNQNNNTPLGALTRASFICWRYQ